MSEEKIYPSMVIRSQAEAIELLEQENQQLKRNCNIGYEELNFYRGEYKKIKPVLDEIREYINNTFDISSVKDMYKIMDGIEEILDKVQK